MNSLPPLNLPAIPLRIKREGENTKVWDPLRRKFVVLTPEEYVRQHFVAWLTDDLGYPPSVMANETGITVNGIKRRCDTVVFNPDGSPLMIIEYKAPDIKISQDTFDQIIRYNMTLRAHYLVVSNGINHYCCVIDYANDTYHFIPQLPEYREMRFGNREN